jgi:hypothetical protein
VKLLKLRAQKLFNERPRSKEEILAIIKEEIQGKIMSSDAE